MHGGMELAVTRLTQVEGPPVVQLLAVGMMAYLWAKGGALDRQTHLTAGQGCGCPSGVFCSLSHSSGQPAHCRVPRYAEKTKPCVDPLRLLGEGVLPRLSGRKSPPKEAWACPLIDTGTP